MHYVNLASVLNANKSGDQGALAGKTRGGVSRTGVGPLFRFHSRAVHGGLVGSAAVREAAAVASELRD